MNFQKYITKAKELLVNILVFLASLLIVLLIAELCLNLFSSKTTSKGWDFLDVPKWDFFIPDKDRIYKIKPDMISDTDDFDQESDKFGFRFNLAHTLSNYTNYESYRNIVLVGDSFTFGHGVGHDETYPYFLERVLTTNFSNVAIHNAGVPGYGLDQEYIYLVDEIFPKYNPKLVVWNLNTNDIGDMIDACLLRKDGNRYVRVSGYQNTLYIRNCYIPTLPKLIRNSRILQYVLTKIPERFTIGCSIIAGNERTTEAQIIDKLTYLFQNSYKVAKEHGSDILLVVVLHQQFFDEKGVTSKWSGLDSNQIRRMYYIAAKLAKVPILDINNEYATFIDVNSGRESFSRGNEFSELFLDEEGFDEGWRHPNMLGNRITAEIVADKITNIFQNE